MKIYSSGTSMDINGLIDYLDYNKYDLVPDQDIELDTKEGISFYLYWHTPSFNLNYYPIVDVLFDGNEVFWQEGSENPDNWYKVVDRAIASIKKFAANDFKFITEKDDEPEEEYDPSRYGDHSEEWYIARSHGEDTEPYI